MRVAILSAMETVNPDVPSTLEAAALCKMADRGQITGGNARRSARARQCDQPGGGGDQEDHSPVAGRANVLVVPDLEAGNMLAKSLSFLAGADAAGIVLGAKVPIILTSRADEKGARLASCAVAQLLVAARRAHRRSRRSSSRPWRRSGRSSPGTSADRRHRQRPVDRLRLCRGLSHRRRRLAITWLNEKARPHVEPLARRSARKSGSAQRRKSR